MSSDPPRHGRRTFPRNYTFYFLFGARIAALDRMRNACACVGRGAPAFRASAWWSGSHGRHLHAPAVHPRRPTGNRRPRASRVHVVVQN